MDWRILRTTWWLSASLALVLPLARADDDAQVREALWLADRAKLADKVRTMVIGDVDLKDVTVDQVFDFLRRQSKVVAPDHRSINLVNEIPPENKLKVSIKLKDATIAKVLGEIPLTRYSIGDFVVSLRMDFYEELFTRTFLVPDNLLAINDSMILDKEKRTYDVRPLFEAKGIRFAPGESATYVQPAKTLSVVFVDPEVIIRVDELLVFGFKNIK